MRTSWEMYTPYAGRVCVCVSVCVSTHFFVSAKVSFHLHVAPHGVELLLLRQRLSKTEVGRLGQIHQQPYDVVPESVVVGTTQENGEQVLHVCVCVCV